ncbi:hypothetical protein MTP99_009358 [Tenebrio molitor]|nr:hypothetical protein MTP99_009358 [Tenebrio molitor]
MPLDGGTITQGIKVPRNFNKEPEHVIGCRVPAAILVLESFGMTTTRIRPCCVPGCTDKETARFSIPSDELVRQIWVSRINNPKLIEVPEHAVAYYRVCARHFHDMCFVTGSNNKKLQRYSLHSFAHTTKALLVNNLVSPRAIGGNCEDDGSLSYLDNLKSFLNTQVAITATPLVLAPVYPPEETVQLPAEDNMDLATAYVSGVIGKKLRKNCLRANPVKLIWKRKKTCQNIC